MRVLCDDQRSEEWLACRRGKITASSIQRVLAGPETRSRNSYMMSLVFDLEGVPDFNDEEPGVWFEDGRKYESWARGWYSWNYNVDVSETGFVLHDEFDWIGCSPDGIVEPDGLIEIKYRKSLKTYDQHTKRIQPSAFNQMQMQMYVMDRAWCDYVNYWRNDDNEEKGHVQRVQRDDERLELLIEKCHAFWADVNTLFASRAAGAST